MEEIDEDFELLVIKPDEELNQDLHKTKEFSNVSATTSYPYNSSKFWKKGIKDIIF